MIPAFTGEAEFRSEVTLHLAHYTTAVLVSCTIIYVEIALVLTTVFVLDPREVLLYKLRKM